MNDEIVRKFEISGRVQGVGYRWYVLKKAAELGLKGSVKNNQDSSVTVIAQGKAFQIHHLRLALQEGPQLSRVTGIKETEIKLNEDFEEFKVLY